MNECTFQDVVFFEPSNRPIFPSRSSSTKDGCVAPLSFMGGIAIEDPVVLIREVLGSKPSEQISKITNIKQQLKPIDLLKAATSIGTGSARMMAGSIISEMDNAWSAWSYLSKGRFGDDAISYVDWILETPDVNGEDRIETLLELVNNYSAELKNHLLDVLVTRDELASNSILHERLKSDKCESVRDYAASL